MSLNEILVDVNTLKLESHVKFLGIILHDRCSRQEHSDQLVWKLNSLSYMFFNLRDVLSEKLLLQLYYNDVETRLR